MSVRQEPQRQLPADALEFSVAYSNAKGDFATAHYHYTPRVPVIYWATFLMPNFPDFIIESGELPTRDFVRSPSPQWYRPSSFALSSG